MEPQRPPADDDTRQAPQPDRPEDQKAPQQPPSATHLELDALRAMLGLPIQRRAPGSDPDDPRSTPPA